MAYAVEQLLCLKVPQVPLNLPSLIPRYSIKITLTKNILHRNSMTFNALILGHTIKTSTPIGAAASVSPVNSNIVFGRRFLPRATLLDLILVFVFLCVFLGCLPDGILAESGAQKCAADSVWTPQA